MFQEVRLDSGTAYPRCNENEHCQIHWETGKGQQVGMNSESEYSQLRIDTTHIRWHKRMFIFFSKNQEKWGEIPDFLSQSRRLPLLQVVSNNKSFSVGVQSPTEINAPRGCAVILR